MGYNNNAAPHSFDPRQLPARKISLMLRVLIITAILSLGLILPLVVWAYFVFVRERTVLDRASLTIYTTAGPTQFVLVVTVSTTISKLLLGPLMALHAYTAAADWLESSSRGSQYRLPSPTQQVHL